MHLPRILSFSIFCLFGASVACNEDDDDDDTQPPLDSHFATKVVSFTPGACSGYNAAKMPGIVLGAPDGSGATAGSLDVVSLGFEGEIVLSFEPNAIVDGEGPDFVVFENAFQISGDSTKTNAEPGEVSVSEDGITFTSFPCATVPPYEGCAGVSPVLSSKTNGVSPLDPTVSGGDAFDLKTIGVAHARFVRIRDIGATECPSDPAQKLATAGFDLDAVAIIHGDL